MQKCVFKIYSAKFLDFFNLKKEKIIKTLNSRSKIGKLDLIEALRK
jgi:hypothetical protein